MSAHKRLKSSLYIDIALQACARPATRPIDSFLLISVEGGVCAPTACRYSPGLPEQMLGTLQSCNRLLRGRIGVLPLPRQPQRAWVNCRIRRERGASGDTGKRESAWRGAALRCGERWACGRHTGATSPRQHVPPGPGHDLHRGVPAALGAAPRVSFVEGRFELVGLLKRGNGIDTYRGIDRLPERRGRRQDDRDGQHADGRLLAPAARGSPARAHRPRQHPTRHLVRPAWPPLLRGAAARARASRSTRAGPWPDRHRRLAPAGGGRPHHAAATCTSWGWSIVT